MQNTGIILLGRIACARHMSHVAWSVCLSVCVGHTGELCITA